MYTFVVIGCERDLALLELQAQSMSVYLPQGQEIILIINENNPQKFLEGFSKFQHYYNNFNLMLVKKDHFNFMGGQPYVDQQILKLAAAQLTDKHLLVLDSQNFLMRPYVELPIYDEKIPYRQAPYAMDERIWEEYCTSLGHELPLNLYNMCLSTPIYLNKDIIENLIDAYGGLHDFASWFYVATRSKSEFALYLQWCEKHHGLEHYHYLENTFFDWAGPYLRDSQSFDADFNLFIKQLEERIAYQGHDKNDTVLRNFKPKCSWSSVNHRAWGDMSEQQFERLTKVLKDVKLTTNSLIEYRSNYVYIPI